MRASENKRLLQAVFHELGQGSGEALIDCLAEDCRWTVMGSTSWSGVYAGKESIVETFLNPLAEEFADKYINSACRFVAEGEFVVVQSKGRVTTRSGAAYNNNYCYVCRVLDGQLHDLVEYSDTELISNVLSDRRR